MFFPGVGAVWFPFWGECDSECDCECDLDLAFARNRVLDLRCTFDRNRVLDLRCAFDRNRLRYCITDADPAFDRNHRLTLRLPPT